MKKLRAIVMADRQKALMKELLHLGCVEIGTVPEQEQAHWRESFAQSPSELAQIREELERARRALQALARWSEEKTGMFTPRPSISKQEFFREEFAAPARQMVEEISAQLERLEQLDREQEQLQARVAALLPWQQLELPLDSAGTQHAAVHLGVCPGGADVKGLCARMEEEGLAARMWEVSGDKRQKCLLVVLHRQQEPQVLTLLREIGWSAVAFPGLTGTAADNISAARHRLAQMESQRQDCTQAIARQAPGREQLAMYVESLCAREMRERMTCNLLSDGTVSVLEGWVPAEKEPAVRQMLERLECAWEFREPEQEEYPQVPVQLKNNWLTRPINMVSEMYSLPAYNGVDPNPLMAPFFIFFYGFMMADMGYGLLMMLASLIVWKKAKPNGPTMRHLIPLLGLCGVSTFVMGALTGGFFGDMIPQLVKMLNPDSTFAFPALFSPLDDALAVLIGSLALGLVQIFTGMGISLWMKLKRGDVMGALCGEVTWYLIFLCLGGGIALGKVKLALIVVLALVVLTQGYGKKGIAGKLMGIGGSLYNNITGYFSDILSYSRLMALMLAGAVIAQVFNTLGGITGNVVLFFLISAVGNALNFALNLLGCYVHDMRLQCLEFFGRFYEDGGRPFRPLAVEPKYVDIVEE